MDNDRVELTTFNNADILPPDSFDKTEKLISSAASAIHPLLGAVRAVDKAISCWHSNAQAEISLKKEKVHSDNALALRKIENDRLEINRKITQDSKEFRLRTEEIEIAHDSAVEHLRILNKESKRNYKTKMKELKTISRDNASCTKDVGELIDAAINSQGENVRLFLQEARYHASLRK